MRVAVVGATGAVGSTILGIMRERAFPADEVVPFASERSAGRTIDWGEQDLTVVALSDEAIQGFDLALFSAGSGISEEWGPKFAAAGAIGRRQLVLLAHEGRRPARRRRGQPRAISPATTGSSPTRTARRCRWSSR